MPHGFALRSAHAQEGLQIGGIERLRRRAQDHEHLVPHRKRDEEDARGVSEPHEREKDRKEHDLRNRIGDEEKRTRRAVKEPPVPHEKPERERRRERDEKSCEKARERNSDVPPEFSGGEALEEERGRSDRARKKFFSEKDASGVPEEPQNEKARCVSKDRLHHSPTRSDRSTACTCLSARK